MLFFICMLPFKKCSEENLECILAILKVMLYYLRNEELAKIINWKRKCILMG